MCLYADDSTYTHSDSDPNILKEIIDARYQNIIDYMAKNKLVLNTEKTHLLIMASRMQHRFHGDYGITLNTGSEVIQATTQERLLGAIISDDMEWNIHIRDHSQSLLKNLSTRLNALSKVCAIASFSTRKLVANGIFMSSIISLIQLWSGTSETMLTSLQVAQNRAARLVTKLPPLTSSEELLRQVGWLSVRQLSVYYSLTMVFNIKKSGKPLHFAKMFGRSFPRETRYGSQNAIYIKGKVVSNLQRQNFTYRSAVLWNSLPGEIRIIETSSAFKQKLKEWVRENIS